MVFNYSHVYIQKGATNNRQTKLSECEYFMDLMLLHVAVINAPFSLARTAIEHSLKVLYRNFKGV